MEDTSTVDELEVDDSRCSSIIYEGVATSYLFAIGNIKHANTIAEKAVKRMR